MAEPLHAHHIIFRHTLFGVSFGLLFPVAAIILDCYLLYGQISINLIIIAHQQQPLLWIIDSAPLVLGLAFSLIGLRTQKLIESIRTEKRYAEEKERAEAATKAKSVFLANISHEVRTPITAIYGAIVLLLGQKVDPHSDKAKHLLEASKKNCDRIIELVNSVIDFEKIESGMMPFEMERYELGALIREVVDMHHEYATQFHVHYKILEPLPTLYSEIDHTQFLQALSALLTNAAKFSKENDTVELSLQMLNDCHRITITDHGEGIPQSFYPLIFNAYAQADLSDSRKRGTGLGLSICKMIIDKHNGKVWFESEPGIKTAFHIDLPIAP